MKRTNGNSTTLSNMVNKNLNEQIIENRKKMLEQDKEVFKNHYALWSIAFDASPEYLNHTTNSHWSIFERLGISKVIQ